MQKKSASAAVHMSWLTSISEIFTVLRRELVYIWYYFDLQLRQIFWYWVFGMVIGALVSVFAKDQIHGLFAGILLKSRRSFTTHNRRSLNRKCSIRSRRSGHSGTAGQRPASPICDELYEQNHENREREKLGKGCFCPLVLARKTGTNVKKSVVKDVNKRNLTLLPYWMRQKLRSRDMPQ